MKILTASSNKHWLETIPTAGLNQTDEQKKCESEFRQHLIDILLAENLVVFTGLGSSLSVNKMTPNKAPSMADLWKAVETQVTTCLLYTSPSPRDRTRSRMPSSA